MNPCFCLSLRHYDEGGDTAPVKPKHRIRKRDRMFLEGCADDAPGKDDAAPSGRGKRSGSTISGAWEEESQRRGGGGGGKAAAATSRIPARETLVLASDRATQLGGDLPRGAAG